MSRCYLDTNFIYAHLRAPAGEDEGRFGDWRKRVVAELIDDSGVISALVIDELAYRLVLAWLRDDGDKDPSSTYRIRSDSVMRSMRGRLSTTWGALDSLGFELEPTNRNVVDQAQRLMADPGLAPRDAFHAAHALQADCTLMVSSDAAFDRVSELRRLGP